MYRTLTRLMSPPNTLSMQRVFFLSFLAVMLFGCNMNPNKEARIEQLETELEQSKEKIDVLESRIQALENARE